MIKTQIENVLGLKALAWSYTQRCFVSPARLDFVWSPGGLQASVCGRGHKHRVPSVDCTCGLYAAYNIDIINEYTHQSPISPIFLVEASGHTVIHELGWRSAEMTVHMVAVPPGLGTVRLAAQQAADYFGIEVVDLSTMILLQDLFNTVQLPYYHGYAPELQGFSREMIVKMCKEYYVAK